MSTASRRSADPSADIAQSPESSFHEEDYDEDDASENDEHSRSDSQLSSVPIAFSDMTNEDADEELKVQTTFPHINDAAGFEPNPEIGAFLSTVPVLRSLTEVECNILGGAMVEQKYAPNDVIIKQDSVGDGFYILKSGTARVRYTDPKTKQVKDIENMTARDYFGEAALLNNAARGASVVAMEPCVALFLHRDYFQRLFTMPDGSVSIQFAKRKAVSGGSLPPSGSATNNRKSFSLFGKSSKSADASTAAPVASSTTAPSTTAVAGGTQPAAATSPNPETPVIPPRQSVEIRQPLDPDRTKTSKVQALLFNALKGHVLLAGMEDAHKEKIIEQMWRTKVPAGTTVIEQGELGDNFYVLEKGKLDVLIRTPDGKGQKKVGTLSKAGTCFGELALMYDTPRAATIVATSKSTLWVLDRITFRRILRNVSEVKLKQYETFLSRVPLLAPLSNSERSKVAEALETLTFKDGDVIVTEGERGDSMFFIASGTVSVTKKVDGSVIEVNRLGEGDYFGERCLLNSEANILTAVTYAAASLDSAAAAGSAANSPASGTGRTLASPTSVASTTVISPVTSPTAASSSTSATSSSSHNSLWNVIDQNGIRTATVRAMGRVEVAKLDRYAFQLLLGPVNLQLQRRQDDYQRNEGDALARRASATTTAIAAASEGLSTPESEGEEQKATALENRPSSLQGRRYNLDEFNVLGFLGKGGYGHVELVEHKVTKETFALKTLYRSHIVKTKSQNNVLNEKSMLMRMDSPYIIRCYETYKDEYRLYFLLEPALGGELYTLLRMRTVFNDKTAKFYAASVVLALQEIHRHDVVYRDLKPENLLLDAEGYIKVTDFGLSKYIPEGRTFTICGTPHYLAPEIIAGAGHNKAVDFWCLGVLIYEMLTGHPPFYREKERADPLKLYRRISAGDYQYKPEISEDAWNLISNLLVVRPSGRLGIGQGGFERLKKHPWFNTIDWGQLQARKLRAPIIPYIKAETDLHNFKKPTSNYYRPLEPLPPEEQGWDAMF